MAFDRTKFGDALHYIVWRCSDPSRLGSVKINKILWYSDARHYVLHGRPITGERYVRRQHGPMAQHFNSVLSELSAAGRVTYRKGGAYEAAQYRAMRAPDSRVLSDSEREILDYFIRHISRDHTATSISEQTHDYAWEIARMGEALPYHAILAERTRQPNSDELAWARDVARRRNLP